MEAKKRTTHDDHFFCCRSLFTRCCRWCTMQSFGERLYTTLVWEQQQQQYERNWILDESIGREIKIHGVMRG